MSVRRKNCTQTASRSHVSFTLHQVLTAGLRATSIGGEKNVKRTGGEMGPPFPRTKEYMVEYLVRKKEIEDAAALQALVLEEKVKREENPPDDCIVMEDDDLGTYVFLKKEMACAHFDMLVHGWNLETLRAVPSSSVTTYTKFRKMAVKNHVYHLLKQLDETYVVMDILRHVRYLTPPVEEQLWRHDLNRLKDIIEEKDVEFNEFFLNVFQHYQDEVRDQHLEIVRYLTDDEVHDAWHRIVWLFHREMRDLFGEDPRDPQYDMYPNSDDDLDEESQSESYDSDGDY